jgi:hypothetical protein
MVRSRYGDVTFRRRLRLFGGQVAFRVAGREDRPPAGDLDRDMPDAAGALLDLVIERLAN